MEVNQHKKLTYLREALKTGRDAFEQEKCGHFEQAEALYSKAANSLNWAIALEFDPQLRSIYLKFYDRFSTTISPIRANFGTDEGFDVVADEDDSMQDSPEFDDHRSQKSPLDELDLEDRMDVDDEPPFSHPQSSARPRKKRKGVLDPGQIVMKSPNVRWNDVVGLEGAMQTLKEAVILPLMYPDWFQGQRKPWRAILLYGPPGTGKTLMARALAGESRATFLSVTAADLLSKFFGQSEKAIKELFQLAKARKPSVVFIDEVDSFCCARTDADSSEVSRRITNELLTQMQGIGEENCSGVLVLATTNIPWKLDPAVRRRFQKRIYVPLPDEAARRSILELNLKDTPHLLTPPDLMECATRTQGFSGSDLANVVQVALMRPIQRVQNAGHFRLNPDTDKWEVAEGPDAIGAVPKRFHDIPPGQISAPLVTRDDLFASIADSNPTVRQQELQRYEDFAREHGN